MKREIYICDRCDQEPQDSTPYVPPFAGEIRVSGVISVPGVECDVAIHSAKWELCKSCLTEVCAVLEPNPRVQRTPDPACPAVLQK